MRVLVTGSAGLIGSAAVEHFDALGARVVGIDNNQRADLFGPLGDTTPVRHRLEALCSRYRHVDLDIRDRAGVDGLVRTVRPDVVVHAAAQPSHDLAARRPFDDFDINAAGTLNLLEACRRHAGEAVFVTLSTNKVYGDGPNHIPLVELDTRWDFANPSDRYGIAESFPVDQQLHSVFGASKLAADVLTQEYGRYFGLRTGTFRAGCLTGPNHAGVELHGFLSFLVDCCVAGRPYTVYGYKGKQVRDQLHSTDVVQAVWEFAQNPRPGEVYNLGGGRANSASVVESIDNVEAAAGRKLEFAYDDVARKGDHICYYSDTRKFTSHYPGWHITRPLGAIIDEMVAARRAA